MCVLLVVVVSKMFLSQVILTILLADVVLSVFLSRVALTLLLGRRQVCTLNC